MTIEDPVRHLGYLQQCLASDKKPLGLFLGAGCPMSVANSEANGPLIPDVAGITRMVYEALAGSEKCKDILKRVQGHFEEDGYADATVEDTVKNKLIEKHHVFLSEELLSVDYASSRLDPEGAWQAIVRVVGQVASP